MSNLSRATDFWDPQPHPVTLLSAASCLSWESETPLRHRRTHFSDPISIYATNSAARVAHSGTARDMQMCPTDAKHFWCLAGTVAPYSKHSPSKLKGSRVSGPMPDRELCMGVGAACNRTCINISFSFDCWVYALYYRRA